ncbi:MAG: cytidine deaminase [Gemmatimonadales bacterium]|nr:cytidine deaminase [Gemmatimonadota bacterium]MCL4212864.1 cytidine deaminase [Gemmatimonadales bacterium]
MSVALDASLPALRAGAQEAMLQAYAPYSEFRVGAALLTESGAIVSGCNVENASYPAGICAERAALGAAVAAGHRRFTAVMIVSEASEPTPPCGICRQALVEFAPSLAVVSRTVGGSEARWTLDELLPRPFTPSSLQSR